MDTDDVELELEVTGRDGNYRVEARSTIGGESGSEVEFRLEDLGVERQLERLRLTLLRSAATTRRVPARDERPVQRLGAELFDRLFTGDVRLLFDMTRQQAVHRDVRVRLVLRIRPPELAVLPWEFMYDARRDDYLSLSMPLVRYPEILEPVRPLRVTGPLRILGMVARPAGYDALDVDGEKAHLHRALAPLIRDGGVHLGWVPGETWRDLLHTLSTGSWHVVHFIGHGGFDPVAGEGVFYLPGDGGENYQLRASHLAQLLSPHHALRLVMLNSCDSAAGSDNDLFSSAAAALVRRGVPAVLAMQFEISDSAAVEFTRSFYEAVAAGEPVDIAVRDARLSVCLSRPNSLEWGIPVLFLRQRDGRIFDVKAPVPATGTEEAQLPKPGLQPRKRPPDDRRDPPETRRGDRVPDRRTIPHPPGAPTQRVTHGTTPVVGNRSRAPAQAPTGAPVTPAPRPSTPPVSRLRAVARGRRALAGAVGTVVVAAVIGLQQLLSGESEPGPPTTVPVAADSGWTRTGIELRAGQQLTIEADGEASLSQGVTTGPDGTEGAAGAIPVTQEAAPGALIARIGGAEPFRVGESASLTAPADGELFLCVNDRSYDDNTGHYNVRVQVG
ncbi:CHAT domain-containing protein [Geodermatophilus sp. URMC 61]|uniref:CHAT domain-containing protein n=1 Tax=Geodermatophilus sp. URMC 61 TaxID=3423411 RepID=UPI00406C646E